MTATKEPLYERIERWLREADKYGINLSYILIHPDDRREAMRLDYGLPYKVLGES